MVPLGILSNYFHLPIPGPNDPRHSLREGKKCVSSLPPLEIFTLASVKGHSGSVCSPQMDRDCPILASCSRLCSCYYCLHISAPPTPHPPRSPAACTFSFGTISALYTQSANAKLSLWCCQCSSAPCVFGTVIGSNEQEISPMSFHQTVWHLSTARTVSSWLNKATSKLSRQVR